MIEDNSAELTRPTSSLRAECFLQLNDLKASVLSGTSGFLRGVYDEGHDVETWNNLLMKIPESERNWLDAPWLITEFYFCKFINLNNKLILLLTTMTIITTI